MRALRGELQDGEAGLHQLVRDLDLEQRDRDLRVDRLRDLVTSAHLEGFALSCGRPGERGIQAERAEHVQQVLGQESEVEVAIAPAVDPVRHGQRVREHRGDLVVAQAGADVRRPVGRGLVVLVEDDAEHLQRAVDARERRREVLDQEELEERLGEVREQRARVDAARRVRERLGRAIHGAHLLDRVEDLLERRIVRERFHRGQCVGCALSQLGVGRRQARCRPSQPAHEGAEAREIPRGLAQRGDRERQVTGDDVQRALVAHRGKMRAYSASIVGCLCGSTMSTRTYWQTAQNL